MWQLNLQFYPCELSWKLSLVKTNLKNPTPYSDVFLFHHDLTTNNLQNRSLLFFFSLIINLSIFFPFLFKLIGQKCLKNFYSLSSSLLYRVLLTSLSILYPTQEGFLFSRCSTQALRHATLPIVASIELPTTSSHCSTETHPLTISNLW